MAITVTPGQALTPREWEALFGQHRGGGSVVNISAKKALKDQILSGEDQRPIYRYYANDGSYVEARTHPNGEDYEVVDYKPSKEFLEAAPAALSPAEQRQAELNRQSAANAALPGPNPQGATEAERRGQDPRYETDEDRAARAAATIKEQGAAARQGQQDTRQAQIDADTRAQNAATATRQAQQDARQAQIDAQNLATAKAAADARNEPQVIYREVKQADGSTKNVQVRVYPGGREEVIPSSIPGQPAPREPISTRYNPETGDWEEVYRDPTTGRAAVRAVPREGGAPGGPKPAAPSLPQIVVGHSQDALRTAYDGIQAEVDSGRRTAAWGENRRKEVYDAAHLAVSEAQIIEQSRQANQSTAFNVANAQLGYGLSSLENALKFTLSINDKLKPGSGTGGKMFAALFNMQMALGVASGMYSMEVPRGSSVGAPGAPSSVTSATPPPPKLTNPGDPAAVDADLQRSQAELAAGEARRQQALASPVFRPPPPVEGSVAPPGGPAVPSATSATPPVPLPQSAAAPAAPAAPPPTPLPQPAVAPGRGDPGIYRGPPGGGESLDPGVYHGPPGGGESLDPGFFRPAPSTQPTPSFVNPPAGEPGNVPTLPVGMAQPQQSFAALDALRQQYQPQMAAPSLDPLGYARGGGGLDQQTGGIGIPPALARAQIAATPPWRLPPADLERLVQEHGPEAVFGWPGQRLLGGVG